MEDLLKRGYSGGEELRRAMAALAGPSSTTKEALQAWLGLESALEQHLHMSNKCDVSSSCRTAGQKAQCHSRSRCR